MVIADDSTRKQLSESSQLGSVSILVSPKKYKTMGSLYRFQCDM
jgi:hypothetical protein